MRSFEIELQMTWLETFMHQKERDGTTIYKIMMAGLQVLRIQPLF